MELGTTRRALFALGAGTALLAVDDALAKRRKKGKKGTKGDYDCEDFSTQKEAQKFFDKHDPDDDPYGLDADNDGRACEDLP